MKNNNVRLPSHIVPVKYNLTLKPDLESFTFSGQETILLEVKKPTATITLHAKELDVESASIMNANGKRMNADTKEVWAKKISYDKKAETITFTFAKPVNRGKHELSLSFKGVLNEHLRGFYRSSYQHNGKVKYLATTQFEATDARQAFPSFDEPSQKAVFEVSLVVPNDSTAISNTLPTQIREHEAGYKVVQFAPTPKMSTYLVAFIVGDFEYVEGKVSRKHAESNAETRGNKSNDITVRVYTTPGKKHQAKFALDTSIKVLEFYNEYFDIPYPLNTLDMIAIPDFAHGAMENWGAVTYRESALLVDPEYSSSSNKQWAALVIAHELAHQWFGNLVTMEWWTHLWLNEGFASYIEYLAVDHLFPEWDMWTQFAYADLGVALQLDALASTHPIEVEVHHPNEIGEIFDEVSYQKGSSVIRMLAAYLGEKNFRDGLRYYLKKHSYANASTMHLWQAFEKVSGKPVRKLMENWTGKPGHPVVSVQKLSEDKREIKLKLTQERFFSSPVSKKNSKDRTVWQLPVSFISNSMKQATQEVLSVKSKNYKLKTTNWIKLNVGETGFFRTRYPDDLLYKLGPAVQEKTLKPIDRLGIIRDLFALAKAGEISAVEALEFAAYYRNEDNYTVWIELASGLDEIDTLMYGQPGYDQFKEFTVKLFKAAAEKLGWDAVKGESHTTILLRSLLLAHAGYFGDKEIVAEAKRRFKNEKSIHPDIRGVVYSLVAQYGGDKELQKLIGMYNKETLHEERNRLGRALGKFQDPKVLRKAMEFFMSKQVRAQDTPLLMGSSYANNTGRAQTWEFVQKNWSELLNRYGHGGHLLARFIKPLGNLATEEDYAHVKKFFKNHAHPGADRAIDQVLEEIKSNILWVERDSDKLQEFLSER